MICKLQLRRLPVVLFIILFCAIAGCGRRRPSASAPVPGPTANPTVDSMPRSVDVRPDIPSTPPRRDVAILFKNAPGYAEVVAQLRKMLPLESYRVTLVDVEAEDSRRILESLRPRPRLFVVAIGLPAARIARDQLNAPVIFAQVFNYQELLVNGRAIRGVTAMPPLDLQVQDWKKLDPKLQRVGLIVSPTHTELIPQAERAAKAAAVTIKHGISDSDRETLYVFKRLAPQIDGLWLLPDDRILSPTVLHELLSYAASHGVRVCVFSDALLQWGALMSASPTPEAIARTLRRVLESMIADGATAVPAMTPLSEFVVHINVQVAGRLGLSFPSRGWWVVRGPQS
jgi:ABC-type uncharacterized transport system substrate-binding protein